MSIREELPAMQKTRLGTKGQGITVWGKDEPPDRSEALFWPCSGEYPIYDSFLYRIMTDDFPRNRLYDHAIEAMCSGRTVVEIGTGAEALWALACAKAGAKRVFAIESDPGALEVAREKIAQTPYSSTVQLVEGFSTLVTLPERVDLCVSEIIGEIGGAEGAAVVLNDARERFLKPGGTMIPAVCRTLAAGVALPAALMERPCFQADGVPYLEAIFDHVGWPFDVRVGVENHVGNIERLTDEVEFERLDFAAGPVAETEVRELELVVQRDGRLDGLCLWIELCCESGGESLDVSTYLSNWIPVFFPLAYPGIRVRAGHGISLVAKTSVSDDGLHPDYSLEGVVRGPGASTGVPFQFMSSHHGKTFRGHSFYQQMFMREES
jgi:protein arginine N-methyltransferase 1